MRGKQQPAAASVVDRRQLLAALDRVRHVALTRCVKEVLTGVWLDASGGQLQISATNLETDVRLTLAVDGDLKPCVVACTNLLARIKAFKSATCSLEYCNKSKRLQVRGGSVEHVLPVMFDEEFPPIAGEARGEPITLDGQELARGLSIVSMAMARESTRYAVQGALLESDDNGVRLVATDGRRLVVVELPTAQTAYRGSLILSSELATHAVRMIGKQSDTVCLHVHPDAKPDKNPPRVFVTGSDWTLSAQAIAGAFPRYRDVMPPSASRFAVDRRELIEHVKQVSLATSLEAKAIGIELSPRKLKLTARSPESGSSSARLTARFLGGGASSVATGVNPAFLCDALRSFSGDQVVIDLRRIDEGICTSPLLLTSESDPALRWIVMPVNLPGKAAKSKAA